MSLLSFSVSDWCFFRQDADPAEYYARLREIGFEAVEMVPRERRAFARQAGLEILNLAASGMQQGINNRLNHPRLVPEIVQAVREAAEEEIPHVIVFSGNSVEGGDGFDACAEALEQVLPEAERLGRVLVFEMLNRFDHPGYEAHGSAYGFDLRRRLDSPHLKVLLDLYHMAREGEDPAALIAQHGDAIAHLHVAGSPERGFPGPEQAVDYASCVRAASGSGYDGYWGMEFLPGGDPLGELALAREQFEQYAVEAVSRLGGVTSAGPGA